MHLFGFFLVVALFNIKVGLPMVFGFIMIFLKKAKLTKTHEIIALLLLFKLFCILIIHFTIGSRDDDLYLPRLITQDVILLLMLFIPLNRVSVLHILTPIVFLFSIDFVFNLYTIFFEEDPLSRIPAFRMDDILPRVGGIFNHPFASINISASAFFIGVFLRSKKIMFFSLAALFFTGSMKGPLMGILILVCAFILYFRFKKWLCIILILGFVGTVFITTYISANNAEYLSGNYFRALAWTGALSNIVENPIFGTHFYSIGESITLGEIGTFSEYLFNHRNAESQFLQYALDFGIIVAMINPLIFYILIRLNIYKYYLFDRSWEAFSAALMTLVVFSDYFYGSFYGTVLPQFVFAIIVLSYKGSRNMQFFNNPKQL
jgi:hypothetical protein